jgi:hypothetical protein
LQRNEYGLFNGSYRLVQKHCTVTNGQANCRDRELPKNGDVSKSPLPENGSLVPSAGTIFNLKNSLVCINRGPRSPPAF